MYKNKEPLSRLFVFGDTRSLQAQHSTLRVAESSALVYGERSNLL
jgi:hypothetical protein